MSSTGAQHSASSFTERLNRVLTRRIHAVNEDMPTVRGWRFELM